MRRRTPAPFRHSAAVRSSASYRGDMDSEVDAVDPVDDDSAPGPIRVAEVVVAIYRWDAWQETAKKINRRSSWVASVAGIAVAVLAAYEGFVHLPGDVRLSAVVYSPLLGWGVRQWLIGWLSERWLRPVLDEVRGVVVPRLVTRIGDNWLRNLVTYGGASVGEQAIAIRAERRDSSVALVASEYDMSKYAYLFLDVGGGG